MISKLSVRNFKSIKEMDIDCARVNLFIGEPNTGKSNILEALGLLNWCADKDALLSDYVRFENIVNLFYNNLYDKPLEIMIIDGQKREIPVVVEFDRERNNFLFYYIVGSENQQQINKESILRSIEISPEDKLKLDSIKILDYLTKGFHNSGIPFPIHQASLRQNGDGWIIGDVEEKKTYRIIREGERLNVYIPTNMICRLDNAGTYMALPSPRADGKRIPAEELNSVKFYKFRDQAKFPSKYLSCLLPPYGANLLSLMMGNSRIKETALRLFRDFGFKVMYKDHIETFEQAKIIDDEIYHHPYITVSDTLKRMIFYHAAIDSNENSTLVFEEPEVHAFPYYIKQLGDKIGFDESNQYFIATHNPYLLLSILEKTPKENVNVFITDFIDYQTKVKCLDEDEKSKLMDYDPFANLNHFLGSLKTGEER